MPKRGQGMNWIRKERRQAIYARDFYKCVYCLSSYRLTLDHLKPWSKGGSNRSSNLVTCCRACNTQRGTLAWRTFARADEIRRRVRNAVRRKLRRSTNGH